MSRKRWLLGLVTMSAAVLAATGFVAFGNGATASASDARPFAPTAGCGRAPALTSGAHTIQSGGQNRNYIIRVPANYDNNHAYRLIFGFHWNGGTANDVDSGGTDGYNWSYYGLRRLADSANNGTIFVAPQGNGNGWANPGGQDVTFVDDMIRQIEAGLCVDTTQLYSAGFSYGGAMSYALACARANVFRAVAVYSGGGLSGCGGGNQPIAYIGLHGVRDNVLPISNGRGLRDTFVRANGCSPQNPPEPAQGSLTHVVTTYSGCRAGYPVAWAPFDGGHDPGPIDGCTCGGWRSWTSGVVWNFFSQFTGDQPPPSSPPPSSPPPPGGRQIVGNQSGRCVIAPGPSAGTQVELRDCTGQSNQTWTYTAGRQLQTSGNMCLDASGGGAANGTAVIVWSCNGQANQQWTVNQNGTITGGQSGLCLDANGGGTANGTKIILWSCNGQANQQWALR
ncbi:ricin-type beta-trefoil lectin domain protein [Actinoplanes siamensis]|uniref:ricin-type beta-trefoil lectin domain protein n=1 Tax=Actinoplanes siamensis TaxID=1223317 RepID=UPI0019408A9B|nr:ricin-type beta-trefoil lectin domain protein [Actinoplanes siamensis]